MIVQILLLICCVTEMHCLSVSFMFLFVSLCYSVIEIHCLSVSFMFLFVSLFVQILLLICCVTEMHCLSVSFMFLFVSLCYMCYSVIEMHCLSVSFMFLFVSLCYMCYRDPLPLSVIHVPVCVSFAFFDGGKFMLIDPTQKEQLVADGLMMVAMNKHREVCMIETSGCVELVLDEVCCCHRLLCCVI